MWKIISSHHAFAASSSQLCLCRCWLLFRPPWKPSILDVGWTQFLLPLYMGPVLQLLFILVALCWNYCISSFFFSLYMRAQNYWTSWDLNLPVPPGCLLRSLFNGSSAVLSVSPTLHSKGYEKHRQESWPFLLLQIAVLYREAHNSRSFPLDENS